jgi:diguanylate cyclase (GGDEF)-like protein
VTEDDELPGWPEADVTGEPDPPSEVELSTDLSATEDVESGPDWVVAAPDPTSWNDPLTGADGPRLWDRLLASEVARVRRYRRPATVALVEIVGFDTLERVWGAEIAVRTFVRLARTLVTEIRSSDHIARIDRTRFGVLLTETEEIAAINFVERVRAACERQPGELRIAIGWASPTGKADLHDALATAEERLVAEIETASRA